MTTSLSLMLLQDPSAPAEAIQVQGQKLQRLDIKIAEAEHAFQVALSKGLNEWIIMYSGGKDSSAVVCLAFELLRSGLAPNTRVRIVYSDTGMEIPVLRARALQFLGYVRQQAKRLQLPIRCHIRTPNVRNGFWYLLLAKGYPPPHQRFRWCTRRLKIEPVRDLVVRRKKPSRTCVLTGVRFNESRNRNASLHASCRRGGECGQGLWFWQRKGLNVSYLAPIVGWSACDVWDFLMLVMSEKGWPTRELFELYLNGQSLRFGCWMCTVVRQDRTVSRLLEDGRNQVLAPLLKYRNMVQENTSAKLHPESRIRRSDGALGRLTLRTRKKLYQQLLEIQDKTKLQLITQAERRAIRSFWRKHAKGQ
jgi:DNA sulfur modification protein DndC